MRISDWSSDCALPISSLPVAGLPETLDYRRGERARTLEGLSVAAPGNLAIAVYDGNALIAEAGPLLIRDGRHAGYWGDLHGQSGESTGIGASREYFTFARPERKRGVQGKGVSARCDSRGRRNNQ